MLRNGDFAFAADLPGLHSLNANATDIPGLHSPNASYGSSSDHAFPASHAELKRWPTPARSR